jgi:hypothetical protein
MTFGLATFFLPLPPDCTISPTALETHQCRLIDAAEKAICDGDLVVRPENQVLSLGDYDQFVVFVH